jgi:hypothetical protein
MLIHVQYDSLITACRTKGDRKYSYVVMNVEKRQVIVQLFNYI